MDMKERFLLNNDMVNTPPIPCDLQVGDEVKFTNDYGVEFSPRKVIGFAAKPDQGRFIHIDTDCCWFPVKRESLTIILNH